MASSIGGKIRENLAALHLSQMIEERQNKQALLLLNNNGENTCKNCLFLVLKNKCKRKNKYLLTLNRICNYHELKRVVKTEDTGKGEEAYELTERFDKK